MPFFSSIVVMVAVVISRRSSYWAALIATSFAGEINSSSSGFSRLMGELAGQCGQLAALAIAVILIVSPVVGIDALGGNFVPLLQKSHQEEPCPDLLG